MMSVGLNLLMTGSNDLIVVNALINCFDSWQCGY